VTKRVIYFHGYGSSPETSKTARLRESLPGFCDYTMHWQLAPVHAFPIDIDPKIALAELTQRIDSLLLDDMHGPCNMVFVGTSLGGWWASKLGLLYDIPAIIINPAITPSTSLLEYGVSEELANQYAPLVATARHEYFFGLQDKIVDSTELRKILDSIGAKYTTVADAGHRFDGKEFDLITDCLIEKDFNA